MPAPSLVAEGGDEAGEGEEGGDEADEEEGQKATREPSSASRSPSPAVLPVVLDVDLFSPARTHGTKAASWTHEAADRE